jgi:hypothetical protein
MTLKQSTLYEAEDSVPLPNETTAAVSELTDGHGSVEAGIRTFEDTDSKEQQRATTT